MKRFFVFIFIFLSLTLIAWAGVDDMPYPGESTSSTGLRIGYEQQYMLDFYIDSSDLPHIFFASPDSNTEEICGVGNRYYIVEVFKSDWTTWDKRCANLTYDDWEYSEQTIAVAYDDVNNVAWLASRGNDSGAKIVIYKRNDGIGETAWTHQKSYSAPVNDIDRFIDFFVDGDLNGGTFALSYVGNYDLSALIVEDINDGTLTSRWDSNTDGAVNDDYDHADSTMAPNGNVYFIYGDQTDYRFREWLPASGMQSEVTVIASGTFGNVHTPALMAHPSTSEPLFVYWDLSVEPDDLYYKERISGVWQSSSYITDGIVNVGAIEGEYLSNGDISMMVTDYSGGVTEYSHYMQRISGTWYTRTGNYANFVTSHWPKRMEVITDGVYTHIAGAEYNNPVYPYYATDAPEPSPVPEFRSYIYLLVILCCFGVMYFVFPKLVFPTQR